MEGNANTYILKLVCRLICYRLSKQKLVSVQAAILLQMKSEFFHFSWATLSIRECY